MTPQQLVEQALAASRADGAVVIVTEQSETNLRWANNTLTTNGAMRSRRVTVISVVGAASGIVSRSSVSPEAVEELVRESEQAARDAGPADDAMPLVTSSAPGVEWDAPSAETSVDVFSRFAADLGDAFGQAREANRLFFGFAEHKLQTVYLGTSTGVRLRHVQSTGKVELNGKSADFGNSVWTGRQTTDFTDIDVPSLASETTRRLDWGARRIDLPAGRYETILPPSAVADLFVYAYISAAARDADEGRTVFSKAGGGNRIGERISNVPVTLRSDPAAPGLRTWPFVVVETSNPLWSVFDNGAPVAATDWIADGVLRSLVTTRAWAKRSGAEAAPIIDNLIMSGPGGGRSLPDLIAGTKRGLLLTCLWYIREVDPRTLLLTGLTRDGVYLVEDGEVAGVVNNYRFNESPVDLLGRLAEVGATETTLPREWNDFFTRAAMPPIRVADFNMSTVSQAS